MSIVTPEIATHTAWTLDPGHSSVEFKAKHMMVASVRGKFAEVEGAIVGNLDQAHLAEIDVTIQAASIDTHNEGRDTHLRSADFLDVETYPTLTFKSTRIEPVKQDRFKVHGDLTIRDTTREVVLDTEINGTGTSPWGQDVVGISATGEINRKEYGLNWNVALETGGWLVGDTLKIEIEIEAIKQANQ